MCAWGHEVFDNDMACDWAFDLAERGNDDPLSDPLAAVLASAADYIDADDGSMALAAAQTLAALSGNPVELPDILQEWVSLQPKELASFLVQKHRAAALAALPLLKAHNSELRELWAESDSYAAWEATVDTLLKLLTSQ